MVKTLFSAILLHGIGLISYKVKFEINMEDVCPQPHNIELNITFNLWYMQPLFCDKMHQEVNILSAIAFLEID